MEDADAEEMGAQDALEAAGDDEGAKAAAQAALEQAQAKKKTAAHTFFVASRAALIATAKCEEVEYLYERACEKDTAELEVFFLKM